MNREIPGMFYDPEKKKYFKIEKNHTAPAGATYSQEKVQGIKRKQKEAAKREHDAKRMAKEKIQKATFYRHPLIDSGREIGTSIPSGTTRREKQAQVFGCELRKSKLHQFRPWRKDFNLRQVVRSDEGYLIAGGTHGPNSSLSIGYPKLEDDKWRYSRKMEKVIWKRDYRISSLSLTPTGHILTTLDHGPSGESDIDVRRIPNMDETAQADFEHPRYSTRSIPYLGGRKYGEGSIWSSAASSRTDKALFAIGSEQGLSFLSGEGADWQFTPYEHSSFHSHKINNVLSVEWIDPNVVGFGMRNSVVGFRDMRDKYQGLSLHHSAPAQIIRQADEHRLVVAGHGDMAMYDMRFVPDSKSSGFEDRKKANQSRTRVTQPYLTFPEYEPTSIPSMDTCQELGLVVNSSSDGKVQLFSLQTGSPVESPLTRFQYGSEINYVTFDCHEMAGSSGPQTPAVLICSNGVVDQWSW